MTQATDRRKVLDMLVEGKIDAADAERLLARLAEATMDDDGLEGPARKRRSRSRHGEGGHLHVRARSEDGDEIDLRIPMQLLSTGVELSSLLPEAASDAIEDTGIELSGLDNLRGEMLVEAIRDLEIDVDSHDGSSVSIRWE